MNAGMYKGEKITLKARQKHW